MALQQISIRIDDELKKRADESMKLMGTNPTQAITFLYQYIADNGKLPFAVSSRLFSSEEYTRKLLTTVRSIYHFWYTVSESSVTTQKQNGMAYSMSMAAHISALHNDLITNCGMLTGEEVASLMNVLETILSTPPDFYNGKEGVKQLRDKLNAAEQIILKIENNHGIERSKIQRWEDFEALRNGQ